ncbi:MAG: hydantoinase/oxoprolinase family protein, partial [Alphaproteobacteria bacterium]|nr:hydantoinase/oxoprolinase family protein [Alphaproteobacteria bacterium]
DPSRGIVAGLERAGHEPGFAALLEIVHGTTLVPNALIERRGARIGLIATAGFRDMLEIGREPRYDPFDLDLEKPAPLVARELCVEVVERIRADGVVLTALDVASVVAAGCALVRAGCTAVAVVLMHAFRNPAHELAIAEILGRVAPGLDVSLSHRVNPEIGEYARASTTTANAYVRPIVRRYVAALVDRLRAGGFGGELRLMQSNGAAATPATAVEFPVRLVESGTSAGALAAAAQGRRLGFAQLVSFDMGGTTAKICIVRNGEPVRTTELEVARLARFKKGSGLPLRIAAIEMLEIGAGGGSIAELDAMGLLQVGPQSAGAEPGPACYGRGGTLPTVTDADLVLGYLDPDHFLGGEMRLSREAAIAAIDAAIAGPLGLDVMAAAAGIRAAVDARMATAIRLHTIERGGDPRNHVLFAFGGAGPVHAYELARRVGMSRFVCPPHAGVASAVGLIAARPMAEAIRSHTLRLGRGDSDAVLRLLATLEDEALAELDHLPLNRLALERNRFAEMCYAGQGHRITVRVPDEAVSFEARLRESFEAAYRAINGRDLGSRPVEAMTWRVTLAAVGVEPDSDPADGRHALVPAGAKGRRRVYFAELDGMAECEVWDRIAMRPGQRLDGPVVVEERESTTVVGPSGRLTVDESSNLVIDIERR